ncbi:MAG: hypothetical protein U0990_01475 [Candidatus Nanopelagicales bacterium]|nr:hypothetical protein [Candidatus Nanopelagicales bacterium]MDZ4248741.1 hypothetical protein [Candidatus Nanopelagicales bacterium]
MIDRDLVRAARGVMLEAAGSFIGDDEMADRGRLQQFRHIRRREVRKARQIWVEQTWRQRAVALWSIRQDGQK